MSREQADKEMGETCDWAEGDSLEEAVCLLWLELHAKVGIPDCPMDKTEQSERYESDNVMLS